MAKEKNPKARRMALKCHGCGDTIFSRARHDFRRCSCGKCFIDGGSDYIRYGCDPALTGKIKLFLLNTGVMEKTLYKDYNKMKDKYGCIKEKKV